MVHQLSLVSSIPHSKYIQTISTLQALTGLTSPQPIATYTLITRPHNVFRPKLEPGKVNQIEQYYMKCVTTWTDDTINGLDIAKPIMAKDSTAVDRLFSGEDTSRNWTLQISDIPIAGKNQACSAQTIYESTIVHTHTTVKDTVETPDDMVDNEVVPTRKDSFLQFLEELGYEVVNQYWLSGIRFFHGDIVIEIFKLFVRDDSLENALGKINIKLLDESNTFQIRAYINIPKATDVELITQGTKELVRLQEFLKNLFPLEIPDRMFMDSRVAVH